MRYKWLWWEFMVMIVALIVPPIVLGETLDIGFWPAIIGTVAVVFPAAWLFYRHREHQNGLSPSSFLGFLQQFSGG